MLQARGHSWKREFSLVFDRNGVAYPRRFGSSLLIWCRNATRRFNTLLGSQIPDLRSRIVPREWSYLRSEIWDVRSFKKRPVVALLDVRPTLQYFLGHGCRSRLHQGRTWREEVWGLRE